MGLPKINVSVQGGQLAGVAGTEDNVAGLIMSGVAVSGQIALNEAKQIFSLKQAEDLGLTAAYDTTNTCKVNKHISDFYKTAGSGKELWIMIVAKSVLMDDMIKLAQTTNAVRLLNAANGRIRWLGITRVPAGGYTPTTAAGLDDDADAAITTGNLLAIDYQSRFKSLYGIYVEGRVASGTLSNLKNYRNSTQKFMSMVLFSNQSDGSAAVGLVLGKRAGLPVQRSIGRVKDGDIGISACYLTNGTSVDSYSDAELDGVHDKGYIIGRRHIGRNGYYLNFDNNCNLISDDFNDTTRVAVIEKGRLVVANVMTGELLDEVTVGEDGTLLAAPIAAIENALNNALEANLIVTGNASAAKASISLAQNVVSTGQLAVTYKIVPKGIIKEFTGTIEFALSL